ncbi:MAG TPA: glutaredoxin 3 [Pseudomonadales bacterium]|nr:glutaredoxin 3 [Pseudomonadales bacterium]HNC69955.1 glutaredoxin 3 [Pseudomonadales bacterium]
MAQVTIYTTRSCPYCIAARELLGRLGVDYEDIDVGADAALRAEMERRAGRRTVPQIWVGNRHIGGFDDMDELHRQGLLEPLLAATRSDE